MTDNVTAFPRVDADPAVRQGRALLEVIDFLAEHVDRLPVQPYIVVHGSEVNAGSAKLHWFFAEAREDGSDLEQAIAVRRAIGGLWDKSVTPADDHAPARVYLRQQVGACLQLSIVTSVDCWPLD